MGPPRSGTSATYYAMREVFKLPGYGESHVFPIFLTMLHRFWQYSESFRKQTGNLAALLDTASLRATFIGYLRDFYASHYPGGSWVDKTPGADAILSASLVLEAFPESKIILTTRSGLEAVESFRRKFSSSFENACLSWVHCMEALIRVKAEYPTLLKIDQFDMASRPAETAALVSAYLGRSDQAAKLEEFLKTRQPERSSKHPLERRLTLEAMPWTDGEKRVFNEVCGTLMRELEYPL